MNVFLKAVIMSSLIITNIMAITEEISDEYKNKKETNFTKRGSLWLGGNFGFTSFGVENSGERTNLFQFNPIIRFFPANYLMIGPSISWNGMFFNYDDLNKWDFGIEIGSVIKTGIVYSYIKSGGTYSIIPNGSSTQKAFVLPVSAGLIVPLTDVLGLQVEPFWNMKFRKSYYDTNTFGINIGFCGIGKNVTVSLLQGISFNSYF